MGGKYKGINLDWDYVKREGPLSIPGYVKDALVRFKHKLWKLAHQPHRHFLPVYGAIIQYAKPEDTSKELDKVCKTLIQNVTSTFLFYASAANPIMSVVLNNIGSSQAAPIATTKWRKLTTSLTIWQCIQMQSWPIKPVTWSAALLRF